jgi:hypothetical protein
LALVINAASGTNVFMNKKIGELLSPIDNYIVNIIFDANYLPDKFRPINDLELMRVGYERAFACKGQNVHYSGERDSQSPQH